MTKSDEKQTKNLREKFQKALRENLNCVVTFEKQDGTIRKMLCTLREEVLPELKGANRKQNPEILAVWDLEKEAWRCFDIWTVQLFEVGSETIYENCNY